jgi:hypothetical protein
MSFRSTQVRESWERVRRDDGDWLASDTAILLIARNPRSSEPKLRSPQLMMLAWVELWRCDLDVAVEGCRQREAQAARPGRPHSRQRDSTQNQCR